MECIPGIVSIQKVKVSSLLDTTGHARGQGVFTQVLQTKLTKEDVHIEAGCDNY